MKARNYISNSLNILVHSPTILGPNSNSIKVLPES